MSAIGASALPTPAAVSVREEQTVERTPEGHMARWRLVDSYAPPRVWTFVWTNVSVATAAAVRAHYRDHGVASFILKIPRTGEEAPVRWRGGPQIQWQSARFASSMSAEFEEALIP